MVYLRTGKTSPRARIFHPHVPVEKTWGRVVIEFGLVRRFPGYRVSGTSKGYQPRLTVPWVGTERSKRLGNRVIPEIEGASEW